MDEKDKPKFIVIQGGGKNSKTSLWEREIRNDPVVYQKLLGPNASEMDRADLRRRIAFVRGHIFNQILKGDGHEAARTLDLTPDPDHSYFLEDGRLRVRYYYNDKEGRVKNADETVTRGCKISNLVNLKDRPRQINTPPESSDGPPSNEQE
jgi:hypothetical protein